MLNRYSYLPLSATAATHFPCLQHNINITWSMGGNTIKEPICTSISVP
ncbi:MAG: hypothetical protein MJZ64_05790 [Paludibacteraceae bacterium]|nr:hypothetical protein [Paludibacteraceae bacterium]